MSESARVVGVGCGVYAIGVRCLTVTRVVGVDGFTVAERVAVGVVGIELYITSFGL